MGEALGDGAARGRDVIAWIKKHAALLGLALVAVLASLGTWVARQRRIAAARARVAQIDRRVATLRAEREARAAANDVDAKRDAELNAEIVRLRKESGSYQRRVLGMTDEEFDAEQRRLGL